MRRRALLRAAASLPLAGCGAGEVRDFRDFATVERTLDGLLKLRHRTTGPWKLPAMLEHLAQSIEYSVRGYPAAKSRLFQATAGNAAFALFRARGAMRHSLTEPIPGAPQPRLAAIEPAVARLKQAIAEFQSHRGDLRPHFAYGALSRADYERAHLMHLANHWTEVVRA